MNDTQEPEALCFPDDGGQDDGDESPQAEHALTLTPEELKEWEARNREAVDQTLITFDQLITKEDR